MNTGQIISAVGHLALIGWALFGGVFTSEPLPFEVTDVTAVSGEEYAALVAAQQSPNAVADVTAPEPPVTDDNSPDMSSSTDNAPDVNPPESTETAPPDTVPEVTEIAPPEAEVTDQAPELTPPQEDIAMLLPRVSPRPQQRPSTRVAPEAVAQPEPDVRIDDVTQPETAPDEVAETPREPTEATTQEEAATEIVTEAEELAAAAPRRSARPQTRPKRPAPAQETQTDNAAVNDALAEALGGGSTGAAEPSGPPLTRGEKDALRVAVQQCWNVGSLSSEALNTTVVVSVNLSENGKPVSSSIRQISASGGSGVAEKQAYEAARRAIIRCGAKGFELPKDKYDHWRDIEMTFNPEKMRIK